MGCNEWTFVELPLKLKRPYKNGLQWAAIRQPLRKYHLTKVAIKKRAAMVRNERTLEEFYSKLTLASTNGLQWAVMRGILWI